MTDDEMTTFVRRNVPEASVMPTAALRELVSRSHDDAFVADPEAAVVGGSTGAQAAVLVAAKVVALCVGYLVHLGRWSSNRKAQRLAAELYPEFVRDGLPEHMVNALPDSVRSHLFKLYLEERRLLAAP